MSDFTYQEGLPLDWADMNENLRLIQEKYLAGVNNAAIAIAAANFKGNWTALTGALSVPASVYHSSKFWLLLSNLADVTAKVPGVDAEWLEIITGNVMGPASATDNAIARFDGVTGKLVQNSAATVSDAGELALPANGLTVGGTQVAVSAGVANFGVRSVWAPGAVTAATLSVSAAGTGNGRFMAEFTNTDASTTNLASVALRSGADGFVGQFAKYGTEYTGVTPWAGYTGMNDNGSGVFVAAVAASGVIKFITGGNANERMRITAAGDVVVTGPGGLGYGTGSGGQVTQATSKTTAVTLNKSTGQITMNAAALAAGATVFFSLNNSLLTALDALVINPTSSTGVAAQKYQVWCDRVATGVASIAVKNITAGSLSDAVGINFAIIKGATS